MRNINFEDIYDLADDLIELTAESIETSVIGSYETIEELLRVLVSIDAAFTIKDITLCNPELNGYDNAYMLEIDTDWNIWVYPMFTGDKYLISGTDILFVERDYPEYVYDNMEYDNLIKFDIEDMYEDDDCDGDCEHCEYHSYNEDKYEVTQKGNMETHETPGGITQSWSSPKGNAFFSRSFYSSIDEEMDRVRTEWRKFAQMF